MMPKSFHLLIRHHKNLPHKIQLLSLWDFYEALKLYTVEMQNDPQTGRSGMKHGYEFTPDIPYTGVV